MGKSKLSSKHIGGILVVVLIAVSSVLSQRLSLSGDVGKRNVVPDLSKGSSSSSQPEKKQYCCATNPGAPGGDEHTWCVDYNSSNGAFCWGEKPTEDPLCNGACNLKEHCCKRGVGGETSCQETAVDATDCIGGSPSTDKACGGACGTTISSSSSSKSETK